MSIPTDRNVGFAGKERMHFLLAELNSWLPILPRKTMFPHLADEQSKVHIGQKTDRVLTVNFQRP